MLKVAVIGGGSTYTPELLQGFLAYTDTFPLTELWLMDILPERLELVGGFARRMVHAQGAPFEVHLTEDRRAAVQGASYVITQIRVGGMQARREDEYLGHRHGLIGQETTGVGGMAKALRTIPVLLDLASEVQKLAPMALLVNFTNPSGLITEALRRYAPDLLSVGLCNGPIVTKMRILQTFERLRAEKIAPDRAELNMLGLNHFSWYRGFTLDGEDVWKEYLKCLIEQLGEESDPRWNPGIIKALGMVPNGYLQYFYYKERKLREQGSWPPSRAEEVIRIENELVKKYAEPGRTETPEDLMERGGAYYSTAATQLMNSHYNDLGEIHAVNVPHRGGVQGWPEDWVLEMPCCVDATGIHPLPTEPLPPDCFGMLAHIKGYELLTIEAAVKADRAAAYRALLAHPLGPSAERVHEVLEDMLETNRQYLPRFFGEGEWPVFNEQSHDFQ